MHVYMTKSIFLWSMLGQNIVNKEMLQEPFCCFYVQIMSFFEAKIRTVFEVSFGIKLP